MQPEAVQDGLKSLELWALGKRTGECDRAIVADVVVRESVTQNGGSTPQKRRRV